MARWFFEPGHTAAEFCVRHMMVTYVRGHFKNVHGRLNFDPVNPQSSSVEVEIDARGLWTGEPDRDAHLRSPDFLDVEPSHYHRFSQPRSEIARRPRLLGPRGVDHSRRQPPLHTSRYLFGAVANALVGERRRQGPQDSRRFHGHDHDKPPRFRRKLERDA